MRLACLVLFTSPARMEIAPPQSVTTICAIPMVNMPTQAADTLTCQSNNIDSLWNAARSASQENLCFSSNPEYFYALVSWFLCRAACVQYCGWKLARPRLLQTTTEPSPFTSIKTVSVEMISTPVHAAPSTYTIYSFEWYIYRPCRTVCIVCSGYCFFFSLSFVRTWFVDILFTMHATEIEYTVGLRMLNIRGWEGAISELTIQRG